MTEFMYQVVEERERRGHGQRRTNSLSISDSLSRMMRESYTRMVDDAARAYATSVVRPPSITRNNTSYVQVAGNLYVTERNYPLALDITERMSQHAGTNVFNQHLMQCPANGEGYVLNMITTNSPDPRDYGRAYLSSHQTYEYSCIGCGEQQSVTMPILQYGFPMTPTLAV